MEGCPHPLDQIVVSAYVERKHPGSTVKQDGCPTIDLALHCLVCKTSWDTIILPGHVWKSVAIMEQR